MQVQWSPSYKAIHWKWRIWPQQREDAWGVNVVILYLSSDIGTYLDKKNMVYVVVVFPVYFCRGFDISFGIKTAF